MFITLLMGAYGSSVCFTSVAVGMWWRGTPATTPGVVFFGMAVAIQAAIPALALWLRLRGPLARAGAPITEAQRPVFLLAVNMVGAGPFLLAPLVLMGWHVAAVLYVQVSLMVLGVGLLVPHLGRDDNACS